MNQLGHNAGMLLFPDLFLSLLHKGAFQFEKKKNKQKMNKIQISKDECWGTGDRMK